ncbi:MAG: hypothetical protein JNL67_06505 [Planctomycetaceae bacterium]|nr:hypothetical protein [Planctomycetaceae bacterium]
MFQRTASIILGSLVLALLLRGASSNQPRPLWGGMAEGSIVGLQAAPDAATNNDQKRVYYLISGTPRVQGQEQDQVNSPASSQRLREGREVRDPESVFQPVGDRMNCFLPSLQMTVTVLENLTLERVYEILTRHDEKATWEVEGLITEHQGRNYILLHRAVVNSISLDEQ